MAASPLIIFPSLDIEENLKIYLVAQHFQIQFTVNTEGIIDLRFKIKQNFLIVWNFYLYSSS